MSPRFGAGGPLTGTPGVIDEGLEVLTDDECRGLLAGGRLGRIAISQGAVPVVLPVNFVMVGTDVMFFTGPGLKLRAAVEKRLVSFQVDNIDVEHHMGWSVLVVGPMSTADPGDRPRAEALGLYPWVAGDRHNLVRIRPELITGRRILTEMP
jgi:nitroimidazol reductase NimA-like FMN-containing flavoprotein (pyridoxamine 5'-phosphate oxidase superfamily)